MYLCCLFLNRTITINFAELNANKLNSEIIQLDLKGIIQSTHRSIFQSLTMHGQSTQQQPHRFNTEIVLLFKRDSSIEEETK